MKALVYTLLFFILFAAYCTAEADAAVDKDVVLAMAFDEGEGETAKDLSPHENHGTLKGNAGWGVGRFGNAVKFEPMGYVDAGNRRSLKLYKSDFTIAVWANMKETLFGNRHAFIAQDEGTGLMNKWILGYNLPFGRKFTFHSIIVFEDGIARFTRGIGGSEGKPNTWHQVAMVRRHFEDTLEEECTTYLDGKKISRTRSFGNLGDSDIPRFNDAPVTIGWAEDDISLDGAIDEVLIAKRAFTDDEITAHFQGGIKRGLGLAVQPKGKSAAAWGAIKAQIFH
jgi:hypothetical protein